ncbi:MAG: ABC transporter ATP-binding protein [Desulfurococcales archaeon]|nr:ABC transporter ATP-binding protein [Desulfurococcales archaeon]
MRPVLIVEDVRKYYGKVTAVDGVSLTVEEGRVVGLIGPNGAGKTTLLDIISGIVKPDAGRVKLATPGGEIDLTGKPISYITRMGVSRAFQIPNVFNGLTVLDNLRTALIASRRLYSKSLKKYEDLPEIDEEAMRLASLVGLDERLDVTASSLSHGERKLLDIAMALTTKPRVLLLDEPTAGLSAVEKGRITRLIMDLKASGIPMLVVEHDLDVVFSVSDSVVAMHEGKVLARGSPEEVRRDPRLRIAYFGS